APTRDQLRFRSTDGSWNNLEHPEIGRAGTPLGRYLPAVAATPQDVYREPSVLKVSERLLKQKQFIPAATSNGTINALAFAWVNFFVHDFYARGTEFSRAAARAGAEAGGGGWERRGSGYGASSSRAAAPTPTLPTPPGCWLAATRRSRKSSARRPSRRSSRA